MPFSWVDQVFRQLARQGSRSASNALRSTKKQKRNPPQATLQLEFLEIRDVPSSTPVPMATPDYIRLAGSSSAVPNGIPGVGGYSPAQVAQAYGTNLVKFNGVQATGTGTTIAIIDAYSSPTITTDLQAFDKYWNIAAPPSFKVVNQTGGSTPPSPDPGWAGEITLDVEWAHATAPGASILLVECNSAAYSNLLAGVRYAEKVPGVVAISMSFGGGEFAGQTAYDTSTFSPTANPDVVFLASTGDDGAPAKYPSSSPNVLAIGGTSLYLTSNNNYSSETAWGDSPDSSGSGGISTIEKQPTFQKGVVTQSTTMRTVPDVSLVADPDTGVDVYETYGNPSAPSQPWGVVGGTSDASPQWAGLIALTDQGRKAAGESDLNNATIEPMLYSYPTTETATLGSADFHDVVGGVTLGTPNYPATRGYDLATGIGTPIVNNLIPTLVGDLNASAFRVTAPTTADLGLPFEITVTALNSAGKKYTSYTGTVTFSSSDPLADLPGEYTFTAADQGTATFEVTLNTLDNQTITVTDVKASSAIGTVTVDVNAGYTFAVSGIPATVEAGTPENFTVTALTASGQPLTDYSGTVAITSTDTNLQIPTEDLVNPTPITLPYLVDIENGTGSFTATFETTGTQSLTATDENNSLMTGSETGIVVTPNVATQLVFLTQPSNEILNSPIAPAVQVAEEDQFGNVVTTDSSSQVAIALSGGPAGATLTGGGTVTFSNGVATYSGLIVSGLGSGYQLVASSSDLGGTSGVETVDSGTFNVTYNPLLENFTNGLGAYSVSGAAKHTDTLIAAASHPGTGSGLGLSDVGDGNWYYRTDAPGQITPGESVGVWIEFAGAANGRAYFGVGSTKSGTISVVLAPNTNQLLIQNDTGYNTYTTLAAVSMTYSYNSWYDLQVTWGSKGTMQANLFSNNGTTEAGTVSATTSDVTPGDFAFRAIGSTKYFDTVQILTPDNAAVQRLSIQPLLSNGKGSSLGAGGPLVYLEPLSSLSQKGGSGTATSPTVIYTVTTAELALLDPKQPLSMLIGKSNAATTITLSNGQTYEIVPANELIFLEGNG